MRIKFPESCKRYGYLKWQQPESEGAPEVLELEEEKPFRAGVKAVLRRIL